MKLITGDAASIATATVTLMCRKTKVINFGLDFVGKLTFFRRVATRWQEATCFVMHYASRVARVTDRWAQSGAVWPDSGGDGD